MGVFHYASFKTFLNQLLSHKKIKWKRKICWKRGTHSPPQRCLWFLAFLYREHLLQEGFYLIEISVVFFLTDSLISSGFRESLPTSLWPTGYFHLWKDFYFLKYYNDKHKGQGVTAFKKQQLLSLGCDNTRTRFTRRALVFLARSYWKYYWADHDREKMLREL